jgi:hypothetical protein
MRSIRSILPLAALCGCAAPVTVTVNLPPPVAVAAPPATVAPAGCAEEAQAEKAYYEAQRLFQKKRFWEAAPAFVISYNFCNHAQVLCAAGQAYRRAQKCEKATDYLTRCLAGDVPAAARSQAQKLLISAQSCARDPEVVATRGEAESTVEADDAAFATQPWSGALGAAGSPGAP